VISTRTRRYSHASHPPHRYGAFGYPRSYEASDGRRIIWGWLGFGISPFETASWWGLHSTPRVLGIASADDPTTALTMVPVAELEHLRQAPPLVNLSVALINATARPVGGATAVGRHFDALVTYRGLARAWRNATLLANHSLCFGVLGIPLCWVPEPSPLPHGRRPMPAGWIAGNAGGGTLALRRNQDTVDLRVLVDGMVVESYWDGGRARTTLPAYGPTQPPTLSSGLAGVSADVIIWPMASAWLHE
jgi:hypothetical protein